MAKNGIKSLKIVADTHWAVCWFGNYCGKLDQLEIIALQGKNLKTINQQHGLAPLLPLFNSIQ